MERESNPMQALCRSGCGFYGSPATDGLCSLCYKEALKKKQQPPVSAPSPVSSVNNAQSLSSLMETTTAQPTVPCLQTSISVSSTPTSSDSSNDDFRSRSRANSQSMSQSRIPIDDQKCDNKKEDPSSSVENAEKRGLKRRREENDDDDERNENEEKIDAKKFVGDDDCDDDDDYDEDENYDNVVNEKDVFNKHIFNENTIEDGAASGVATSLDATGGNSSDNGDKDGDKDAKKKKNRCATCRKKVGLTGFECRCGGLFCAVHRYSDKHDCSFNYREMGAQEIRRNNPVVVGEKIQKI